MGDPIACPSCTQAEINPYFPRYQAQCLGCSIRELAHSHMFYLSGQAGSIRPDYRKALSQLGEWQEVHAQVKEVAACIKDYCRQKPD